MVKRVGADKLFIHLNQIFCPIDNGHPLRGSEMSEATIIDKGYIAIKNGKILSVGSGNPPKELIGTETEQIDCTGKIATPGLIDSHTHLVYGGSREHEFSKKINGVSYLDILKQGGGILNTVHATRVASYEVLYQKSEKLLDKMLVHGVTTVEAKSGYGLNWEIEKKQLEVVKALNHEHPIDLVSTFMAAHAVPPEYKEDRNGFIALIIENLVNKNILKEQMDGEQISVQFTHSKLRDYMYMSQPASKKRAIHRKIAEDLETQIKPQINDSLLYSKIAFHYAESKNELKSLTYEIAYLQSYLGFHHELFPIFRNEQNFSEANLPLTQGVVFEQLEKIKDKLTSIIADYQEDEIYHLLVIKILYLEGRYLIRHGDYHKGIDDIQRVISKARELNNQEYILKGYKQMVFYYIQVDDTEGMFRYIELALNMAIKGNNHELIGVLLRLKGLYYIMCGDLCLAEKLLKESVSTFMITDETTQKYSINIGAAYNYLGEIRHIEGNETEAIQMYHQAIDICVDKGSVSSLSVFYINTGIALFAQQKYQKARQYLIKAYGLYENFSSLWKRPQLDAYLALINLHEGDDEAVFAYIVSSKKYSKSMSNPRDLGIVYFAEAMIKYQLKNRLLDGNRLSELLPKEATYYYQKALEYLNPYRDIYELNALDTMFKTIQS